MRFTFAELEKLLQKNPQAYRREVERLRIQDPERFARFVSHVREKVGAEMREDPPVTKGDVDALAADLAASLGWPKERVMAEALLRLYDELGASFEPRTPNHGKRPPARLRRHSSIETLVLLRDPLVPRSPE